MKKFALSDPHIKGQASATKIEKYQSITGSIIFLMFEKRSNIVFVILIAVRFVKNLDHLYIKIAKTVLQYLKDLRK